MLKGYGSIFIYIITELITDKFRIKKKKKTRLERDKR